MSVSHPLNIPAQSVPAGNPVVVASGTFAAVALVGVVAGQQLTAAVFTLNADAPTAAYPAPGVLYLNTVDAAGNTDQTLVAYTATSGTTFTGCTSADGWATTGSPAWPYFTGRVSIDKTGAGNRPWMNTLTAASELTASVDSSADGGVTWRNESAVTVPGGPLANPKTGVVETAIAWNVGPVNPQANAVRIVCAAAGPSPIEISGTASITSR